MALRDLIGTASVVLVVGFAIGMLAYATIKEIQAKREVLERPS